jgi:hypothetical protein
MLIRFYAFIVAFSFVAFCNAQDTIRLMEYSLLKYLHDDGNSARYKDLRTIITYVNPDILLVDELETDDGAKYLLDSALNKAGVGTYARAPFINGYDTDNSMYYKTSKIGYKSQSRYFTALRDINQYYVYRTIAPGDTAWLYLNMCHLKAGGSNTVGAESNLRLGEVTAFCNGIGTIPQNRNIIFAGDFNFKGSFEPAWTKITTNCSHLFYDPINQVGTWGGNAFYKNIHTQSNRQSPNFIGCCGGTTGGLDDRFDFIVGNAPIINGTAKMKIIPSSYKIIGNDGNHFNLSTKDAPANSSVPTNINQALFNMTDHLPVFTKILVSSVLNSVNKSEIGKNATILLNNSNNGWEVGAQSKYDEAFTLLVTDGIGKILINKEIELKAGFNYLSNYFSEFNNGLYHITLFNKTNKVSSLFPVN